MRRTRHVVLPVRSWQYIGLLIVSLACLTLGHVSRDREGRHGSLAGPELMHTAPHEVDECPNKNLKICLASVDMSSSGRQPTFDTTAKLSESRVQDVRQLHITSSSSRLQARDETALRRFRTQSQEHRARSMKRRDVRLRSVERMRASSIDSRESRVRGLRGSRRKVRDFRAQRRTLTLSREKREIREERGRQLDTQAERRFRLTENRSEAGDAKQERRGKNLNQEQRETRKARNRRVDSYGEEGRVRSADIRRNSRVDEAKRRVRSREMRLSERAEQSLVRQVRDVNRVVSRSTERQTKFDNRVKSREEHRLANNERRVRPVENRRNARLERKSSNDERRICVDENCTERRMTRESTNRAEQSRVRTTGSRLDSRRERSIGRRSINLKHYTSESLRKTKISTSSERIVVGNRREIRRSSNMMRRDAENRRENRREARRLASLERRVRDNQREIRRSVSTEHRGVESQQEIQRSASLKRQVADNRIVSQVHDMNQERRVGGFQIKRRMSSGDRRVRTLENRRLSEINERRARVARQSIHRVRSTEHLNLQERYKTRTRLARSLESSRVEIRRVRRGIVDNQLTSRVERDVARLLDSQVQIRREKQQRSRGAEERRASSENVLILNRRVSQEHRVNQDPEQRHVANRRVEGSLNRVAVKAGLAAELYPKYLKAQLPTTNTSYEILRQGLIIALCAIYGASIFKGKTAAFGTMAHYANPLSVWTN